MIAKNPFHYGKNYCAYINNEGDRGFLVIHSLDSQDGNKAAWSVFVDITAETLRRLADELEDGAEP